MTLISRLRQTPPAATETKKIIILLLKIWNLFGQFMVWLHRSDSLWMSRTAYKQWDVCFLFALRIDSAPSVPSRSRKLILIRCRSLINCFQFHKHAFRTHFFPFDQIARMRKHAKGKENTHTSTSSSFHVCWKRAKKNRASEESKQRRTKNDSPFQWSEQVDRINNPIFLH